MTDRLTPDLDAARSRFWRSDSYALVLANPEAFARLVRQRRESFGWSQRRLCFLCGFSHAPVQELESLIATPKHLTISKIMNVLALTVGDLRDEIAAMYAEREAA